jgi:hypothetical protein
LNESKYTVPVLEVVYFVGLTIVLVFFLDVTFLRLRGSGILCLL